jgi:hypothetical protein
MAELEEIYDDIQVTTGVHSSTGHNQAPAQCAYQDLVPKSSAAVYTNLSGIKPKRRNADHELNRIGYKSLMVVSGEDAENNEYAIANQSGNFELGDSGNNNSGSGIVRRSSKPLVPKKYVSQKKNVLTKEPSPAEEDKELKTGQKEAPKRNFRVGILCFLVLFSVVISLAALAVAVTSIVWSMQQQMEQMEQYRSVATCFMELLQNESFCGECFDKNVNQSGACMPFKFTS